jgi:hypothetical protein
VNHPFRVKVSRVKQHDKCRKKLLRTHTLGKPREYYNITRSIKELISKEVVRDGCISRIQVSILSKYGKGLVKKTAE